VFVNLWILGERRYNIIDGDRRAIMNDELIEKKEWNADDAERADFRG